MSIYLFTVSSYCLLLVPEVLVFEFSVLFSYLLDRNGRCIRHILTWMTRCYLQCQQHLQTWRLCGSAFVSLCRSWCCWQSLTASVEDCIPTKMMLYRLTQVPLIERCWELLTRGWLSSTVVGVATVFDMLPSTNSWLQTLKVSVIFHSHGQRIR